MTYKEKLNELHSKTKKEGMSDVDILQQLMSGNHLEGSDLERAKQILHMLNLNLQSRMK